MGSESWKEQQLERAEELEEKDRGPGSRTRADTVYPLHGHAGQAVAFARVATDLLARSQELMPPRAGRIAALGRTFEAAAREKLTLSKQGPGDTPTVEVEPDDSREAILRAGTKLLDQVDFHDLRALAEKVRGSRETWERPFSLAALLSYLAGLSEIHRHRRRVATDEALERLYRKVEEAGEEEGKE